jgi:two-component system OmpR family response regulator
MSTILILDDEEDILTILKLWFKRKGYRVHVFTDSKAMCQSFEKCSPDLVLLDINLKGEDGREVCKTIRKELQYNKPVLHFSAYYDITESSIYPCADGFIAKPLDLEELTTTVNSFISR